MGVFNHWAQCLSGAALTLTFFQHRCYQVLWTLKAINQELWMCVKSGAEPTDGVWILGGHGPHLFCPIVAAMCLPGALWWPYSALHPALFYKLLTYEH